MTGSGARGEAVDRRRRRAVGIVVAGVICAGLLASCNHGGSSQATGGSPGDQDPIAALGGATLAQLRYGAGASRNDGITYAPDVVVVDGGTNAIRSLSADGLTWTIDGDAPHARELAVGKIMLITGRAVGRVLLVEPGGPDLTVIVGPVELTDVVEKADVHYDQPLDLDSMVYYDAPDQPGAQDSDPDGPSSDPAGTVDPTDTDAPSTDSADPDTTDPSGSSATEPATATDPTSPDSPEEMPDPSPSNDDPTTTTDAAVDPPVGLVRPVAASHDETIHLPPVHLVVARTRAQTAFGGAPLPVFGAHVPESVQHGVSVAGLGGSEGLGFTFNYNRNGIKLTGHAALHLQTPRLNVSITIDHGIKAASVTLDGAAGLSFAFDAGNDVTPGGVMNDNPQAIDLPFDISIPLGGNTPFAINIRQAFKFQTLFGARLATLSAKGELSLGGSIGVSYDNGHLGLAGPTSFSGVKELASSVTGSSLGVNGMIVTDQIRVIAGLGGWGFAVGPSFTTIFTMAVTNQSALAAVPCTGGEFKMEMGVGLGYAIPNRVANVINFFLRKFRLEPIRASAGLEHTETLATIGAPTSGPCKFGG